MKNLVDEVRLNKLCKLSKFEISSNQVDNYLKMLNNDLIQLEDLNDVEVGNLEPLINPYDITLQEYPDTVSDGNVVDKLMKCAPKELYNYFVVPKVVEK